jgi:tetratricopeptide (TPR) repeat protein
LGVHGIFQADQQAALQRCTRPILSIHFCAAIKERPNLEAEVAQARQNVADGDRQAVQHHLREQLRFELGVFKERTRQYPTDLRVRYQYGLRLFKAGRHDEAIPVLQEARNDPKIRSTCNLYIGRCFFEKGYHAQAIDILKEAARTHEPPDDDLGKDLLYRLGRAHEAAGQKEEALKIYGQIIQWDYNYRNGEVRKRIDDLKNQG